ncbi:sensor histidine kinase [Nocardioides sp.]|uniref:sensor histidine kinase n=1 Tax=Nocardioides sp. TaxID=35761 RepID=UPI0031FED8DD
MLIALLPPVLRTPDEKTLLAFVAICAIWAFSQASDVRPTRAHDVVAILEAAAVALVCAASIQTTYAVVGALAVPPFTVGLARGVRGVLVSLVVETVVFVTVSEYLLDGLTDEHSLSAFSWGVTGLGLGLIASFLNSTLLKPQDPLAPYLYAQTLIRELIDLSGGLSSGLDPNTLGGAILSTVRDDVPTSALAIYVSRGDSLTPLLTGSLGSPEDLSACEDVATDAWTVGKPVVRGRAFAFPLNQAAVVAGLLSEGLDPDTMDVGDRIRRLTPELQASAVHLDTALLFSAFRDSATADERRRLAREMHDGVAQDIASLGYLVDVLAAKPASPEQAERISLLRERISAIVAEVRRSVVNLRTSVGTSESLGMAIGSIARSLSEVSGVPIHVTLDEHTARLRPEVEAELFRIAQEAMNNAIKHAEASRIEVNCQVHAPDAVITVSDDGRGMQQARLDSNGMQIMQERARLIGAVLLVDDAPGRGLTVTVRMTASHDHDAPVDVPTDAIVRA